MKPGFFQFEFVWLRDVPFETDFLIASTPRLGLWEVAMGVQRFYRFFLKMR
jgi:hypothetical protein